MAGFRRGLSLRSAPGLLDRPDRPFILPGLLDRDLSLCLPGLLDRDPSFILPGLFDRSFILPGLFDLLLVLELLGRSSEFSRESLTRFLSLPGLFERLLLGGLAGLSFSGTVCVGLVERPFRPGLWSRRSLPGLTARTALSISRLALALRPLIDEGFSSFKPPS